MALAGEPVCLVQMTPAGGAGEAPGEGVGEGVGKGAGEGELPLGRPTPRPTPRPTARMGMPQRTKHKNVQQFIGGCGGMLDPAEGPAPGPAEVNGALILAGKASGGSG